MKRADAIDILNAKKCPYCLIETVMVNSQAIYGQGHDYGNMYLCQKCGAYVGCHDGTENPLGRLANRELRNWKKKVHKAFDPIWRNGDMERQEAYDWLAEQLNINLDFCHIGMFSIRYCKKAISVIEEKSN